MEDCVQIEGKSQGAILNSICNGVALLYKYGDGLDFAWICRYANPVTKKKEIRLYA
jgi:hypothetical protein